MDGPLKADARDVGPVEQHVRCHCEDKEDETGGDGEEGGEICAAGGFRESDMERLRGRVLGAVSNGIAVLYWALSTLARPMSPLLVSSSSSSSLSIVSYLVAMFASYGGDTRCVMRDAVTSHRGHRPA